MTPNSESKSLNYEHFIIIVILGLIAVNINFNNSSPFFLGEYLFGTLKADLMRTRGGTKNLIE
jgi:hypothetical protein